MELIKAALIGTAFALLLSMPAQESTNTPKQPPAPRSWKIEITSTGGFHGRGDGSITISSDGMATVSRFNKSCRVQIPLESFQDIERLLADLESYFGDVSASHIHSDTKCCDFIQYSLSVKLGGAGLVGKEYSASWFDDLDSEFPKPLRTVCRTSLQLRSSLLADCKQ